MLDDHLLPGTKSIDHYSIIINDIKEVQGQKGLTHQELAERAGITEESYLKIITYEEKADLETTLKLIHALDLQLWVMAPVNPP